MFNKLPPMFPTVRGDLHAPTTTPTPPKLLRDDSNERMLPKYSIHKYQPRVEVLEAALDLK